MIKEYKANNLSELFSELGSSEDGLNSLEARKRLEGAGLNEIPAKDKRTAFSILLSQFKNPLILILIAAAVIAGFLGEPFEATIIVGIVLLNTALGFYQEFKSEKALTELKKYISFKAKVLRDGKKTEVDVKELVPGDLVFLNIGDIVPADLQLIETEELSINESAITGESVPVHKTSEMVIVQSNLPSQQKNIAFMGTTVANGSGKGIVVATGKKTEFGKTATILGAKEPPTDFQKNIKKFGNFLLKVIFLLTIFVFASNAFLGKGILDSFLFALALAVGITPELLPIIITIGLSTGAIRLAKKKVVVKRIVAIEDLGNVDVLCMDKTGTLTENKIALEKCFDLNEKKSGKVLEFALLCNSANIEKGKAKGNPIDTAILEHASEKERQAIESYKKVDENEFDFERRRMSTVVEKDGKRILICKGAPESILSACNSIQKQNKIIPLAEHKEKLKQKFDELSKHGFRIIAVAFKEVKPKEEYTAEDEKEMTLIGYLTFLDPPKKTATEALKKFKSLGVELKVLTGDNELVTREVCKRVEMQTKNIVLGSELEKMTEQEFLKTIQENNVFARITPEQKFKIVTGLSKQGHIVGFLGDGVNDAPALKASDVGITVDTAVDVAKDSADIILLKKSLLVLVDGIENGRKTFGNITKYILNTISANFGNMLTLTISSLFLKFIPLLPSQILLANLISDGPLMTISTDNVDKSYLHKPKKWNIKGISSFMIFFGAISTVFDLATMAVLLFLVNAEPAVFRTAWFLESVLSEIFITFAIRTKGNFWKSKPSKLLIYSSIAATILTIGLIYSPIAFLFKFEQLTIPILTAIGIILLAYFSLAETAKKRFYKTHEI